ncbi:hypothetical protein DXA30_02655 [Fusobacterium ulcerans]|nr:hypothetical protein DXA30_02655 [Fusobacterium ulcerans]
MHKYHLQLLIFQSKNDIIDLSIFDWCCRVLRILGRWINTLFFIV